MFVVDISGSMRGKPIEDTKSVLLIALSKLDSQDLFSIIAFNGETFLFSSSLELAREETIESAIHWINTNFVADGGTNILNPLNQVTLFNYSHWIPPNHIGSCSSFFSLGWILWVDNETQVNNSPLPLFLLNHAKYTEN